VEISLISFRRFMRELLSAEHLFFVFVITANSALPDHVQQHGESFFGESRYKTE